MQMMYISQRLSIMTLFLFALLLALSGMNCQREAEYIKIGALLPLTGPGANYGKWEKQGIDMAVDHVNSEGGINGKPLKILYEDIQSNPQLAVSAFNKLISVDKIQSAVAGISSVVLAMAPIGDQRQVVLLNCGGISPMIPEVTGNYVFSNIVDGNKEVVAMAAYIVDNLQIRSASVFSINSAAGIDAKDVFLREFQRNGGEIVSVEYHDPGVTDFRAQLTKLKDAAPAATYLTSFTNESALILKQARELGFSTRWCSYAPFEGDDILTIAGTAAEGVIYTSQAFDPMGSDPRVRNFQEQYIEKYGEHAEIYAATFHDGIRLLAEAMRSKGITGTAIRDGLREVSNFEGVTGLINFDDRQVAKKPIIFKTVREGKFQIIGM